MFKKPQNLPRVEVTRDCSLPGALRPVPRVRGRSVVAYRSLTLATIEELEVNGRVTPPSNAAEIAHHRHHFAGIPGVHS